MMLLGFVSMVGCSVFADEVLVETFDILVDEVSDDLVVLVEVGFVVFAVDFDSKGE